jgi:hypothetical protein
MFPEAAVIAKLFKAGRLLTSFVRREIFKMDPRRQRLRPLDQELLSCARKRCLDR